MPFVIGRDFAEVQIQLVRHRTVCEVGCPRSVREKCPQLFNWKILINLCIHIDIDKI